jgi:hypothetical protein
MQFTIEVLAVTSTTKPTAKGSYTQLDVAYKRDGKTEGKKIMSFGNSKPAFETLKNAKTGDVVTITSEKNETSGYWDWLNAGVGGTASAPTGHTPTASPKSTYETAEERAKKQVCIVRQSSISTAVELLKTDKKVPDVNEILTIAKQFEAFVFDTGTPATLDIAEMQDDIPY